jgi:peptidoglycan/LPS O-acetylase OafA/YrhL
MRGIAALMVVFHHAGNIIQQKRFYGHAIWNNHLSNFNVGVDFFFVLSGFIISWVHWGDVGQPAKLKSFVLKRFLRIYPLYWTLLIPLVALYLLFPSAGYPEQHQPRTIFLSFLLLPDVTQPVLGVAWTLTYEVFFYALFALLIVFGRKFLAVLALWCAAIIYFQFNPLIRLFPWSFFFSPLNMEFLAGMAVAVWLKHNRMPLPTVVALVGAAAFLYFMLFRLDIQTINAVGRLALGLSSVAIILGLVEVERRMPVRVHPILLLLGTASYAVYLIHPMVLSGLINAGFKVGMVTRVPAELFVVCAAVAAASIGVGYHLLVETRLSSALRRLVRP